MSDRPHFRSLGLALGVLFLLGALYWLGEEIWFASHAHKASALVVSYSRTRRGNGYAIVEFDVPTATVQSKAATIFYYQPTVGQHVRVLYLPDDPKVSRIDTFEQRYLIVLIILGIAVAWNGSNIFGWLRRRLAERRASKTRPALHE